MLQLTVEDKFAAAHQLYNYDGPCENMHGHTWKMAITVEGTKLDPSGILVDFKILKGLLHEVFLMFDHKVINDIIPFSPTSENLAKFIYDHVKNKLPKGVSVAKTVVWESDTAYATYFE